MQCIYQAAEALETGAFGAKNQSPAQSLVFVLFKMLELLDCLEKYLLSMIQIAEQP